MIRILPLALLPGAALAHGGAHAHPHGSEGAWLVLAFVAVAIVAGILADWARR